MLDLKKIQENQEKITELLARKGYSADFAPILKADEERRKYLGEAEKLKAERNKVSASIPALKKEGKPVDGIFAEMRTLGEKIAELDEKAKAAENKAYELLSVMPNVPDEDLLPGEKENNKVIKVFGTIPEFDFPLKNHVDLCTDLKLIDYARGTKLSGGGFWIYRGQGARLEWALLNFFISEHLKDGYEFILPPHQLGYNCGFGAGQFPKFSDEVYWLDVAEDRTKNRFMLPTAETALVNMYAGEILDESSLPLKFFAYTPCYRKEAGSYRAEERGMIRGHQFNKVEMFQFTYTGNAWYIIRTITQTDLLEIYGTGDEGLLAFFQDQASFLVDQAGSGHFYDDKNNVFNAGSGGTVAFDLLLHGNWNTYLIEMDNDGNITGNYCMARIDVLEESPSDSFRSRPPPYSSRISSRL